MTGIRTSAVFRPETSYGVAGSGDWQRLPTGLSVDYSPSNNIKTYNEIGNKFFDNAVADRYTCGFTMRFKLDYKCIAILGAVFENVTFSNGTYTFTKSNSARVKSFELRYKKLNRIVGGNKDQTIHLKGCYVTSFSFSQNSGATLDATVSGNCIMDSTDYSNLTETDWNDFYEDDDDVCVPIEWACVAIGDDPVAYTESVTFGINNNAENVLGCGSRFSQNYMEKNSNITFSTSCYSVNPEYYQQRMYSGGMDATHTQPMTKGLRPIPVMKIRSFYDADEDNTNEYTSTITLNHVYINSMGTISFDAGRKIVDSPSMLVQGFSFEIKNGDAQNQMSIWN